ncbi:MAG TPA: hypothetical protein GX524_02800 [Firmicutes bacterium]|jgi:hypothetical protein|nr:hypothetical protein [Bacillota bacterium]
MAAEARIVVPDGAQEIHRFLTGRLSHIEMVSEDVITGGDKYTAILVYQHYFSRVGNQLALVVIISGDSHKTTVKTVSCGASRGFLDIFDWGATEDFASEPIGYLEQKYNL